MLRCVLLTTVHLIHLFGYVYVYSEIPRTDEIENCSTEEDK